MKFQSEIDSFKLWRSHQDLTFGEISAVVRAAEQAADDKAIELRKAKFKRAEYNRIVAEEMASV